MTAYLKEEDLVDIVDRYRKNKDKTDDFVRAITLIAKNLMNRYPFRSPGWGKDDYIQEAVLICLIRQHHFKRNKGNCFSYFTTVIMNHWKYLWNCDKRFYDIIDEYGKHKVSEGSKDIMSIEDI